MDSDAGMDKRNLRERELVDAAVEHLRRRGIQADVRWPVASIPRTHDSGPRLRLQYAGHDTDYATTLRLGIARENVNAIAEQIRRGEPDTLLVADYVSLPLAEALRKVKQQFIDAAGNAYLERPPLIIWISGMKRGADSRVIPPSVGRAFHSAGMRVVFGLLCNPDWARVPYRELARRTGVAHGSVGEIFAELRELGFISEIRGQRRLLQRGRLQLRWAEAYPRAPRLALRLGRFRATDLRLLADPDLVPHEFCVGGEVAAARLVNDLQPGSAIVYGNPLDAQVLRAWRLSPDPEGNVESRRKFWDFEHGDPQFAPAPLVHADLLASGDDRCLQAARKIHDLIEAGSL